MGTSRLPRISCPTAQTMDFCLMHLHGKDAAACPDGYAPSRRCPISCVFCILLQRLAPFRYTVKSWLNRLIGFGGRARMDWESQRRLVWALPKEEL